MIDSLRLQQFRIYKDGQLEFTPGVNIIVGPNASGKTSILEAIRVLFNGKSYKARDLDLVKHGCKWARLDARTGFGDRSLKLSVDSDNTVSKQFNLNNNVATRITSKNRLPSVIFEPAHLQLLVGSKEPRREFMDHLLEQTTPGYSTTLRQYKRALSQRNSLLKQGYKTKRQLFAWDIRISDLGGDIVTKRMELISKIEEKLGHFYRELSGENKTKIKLHYETSCSVNDYRSSLLKKLEKSVETDYLKGFTAYGPHRDDLVVLINDRRASETASRGENRTLLVGLKLIELKLIEKFYQKKPVLLLDDVFGELDGKRRRALTDFLNDHQAFITTTDADIVVKHFIDKAHIIPTSSG